MFAHVWKMRARRKKVEDYEKFGRQTTLPALKKIDGCVAAHFFRVFGSRKPEYLWVVVWRDREALEAARTNPAWRSQIRQFEQGAFYKSIPLEMVCESLAVFEAKTLEITGRTRRVRKAGVSTGKKEKTEEAQPAPAVEEATNAEGDPDAGAGVRSDL